MKEVPHLGTLTSLATRGLKLRERGISAHIVVFGADDGVSEMLVGCLDGSTCAALADFAKYLRAVRMQITCSEHLQFLDGSIEAVVIATDLASGRQAVVRVSDGSKLKCGRVRLTGITLLQSALSLQEKAAPRKGGGRSSFPRP